MSSLQSGYTFRKFNTSQHTNVPLQENATRLKAFKSKLVLFPRRANKPKTGDSSAEELKAVGQHRGALLPIAHAQHEIEYLPLTDEMKVPVLSVVRAAGDGINRHNVSSALAA